MKQALLLSTHLFNDTIGMRFRRLASAVRGLGFDSFVLLNSDEPLAGLSYIRPAEVCSYSIDQINALGYEAIYDTIYPGSCHFPVLAFAIEHKEYNYIWFVEYDVVYTGRWDEFFSAFACDESDFISSHVERYDEQANGGWEWWHEANDVGYPLERCVKAFNPICRYSRRALQYIDKYQKEGHSAHSEVLIPTCLYNAGMKITDFGGTGEFVRPGWRNKSYVQGSGTNNGTMRYRPVFLEEEIKALNVRDKLFHPLK